MFHNQVIKWREKFMCIADMVLIPKFRNVLQKCEMKNKIKFRKYLLYLFCAIFFLWVNIKVIIFTQNSCNTIKNFLSRLYNIFTPKNIYRTTLS